MKEDRQIMHLNFLLKRKKKREEKRDRNQSRTCTLILWGTALNAELHETAWQNADTAKMKVNF